MYFLEVFNKIFCYDKSSCITFVYADEKWEISKFPLHNIETMDLRDFKYLTFEEAKIKTNIAGLHKLREKIKKIYEGF